MGDGPVPAGASLVSARSSVTSYIVETIGWIVVWACWCSHPACHATPHDCTQIYPYANTLSTLFQPPQRLCTIPLHTPHPTDQLPGGPRHVLGPDHQQRC
jgi:hypothetical protein